MQVKITLCGSLFIYIVDLRYSPSQPTGVQKFIYYLMFYELSPASTYTEEK